MPVTKSAKKKLKKDKKRTRKNKDFLQLYKAALKKAKKHPTEKTVKEAVSLVDKAVKKNIIHKNKASRIKSALSKLIKKPVKKNEIKTAKSPRKSKAKTA